MPTFEQRAATSQDLPWLEAQHVPVSSADRWTEGSVCYAPGWALGRLKRIAAADITAAYTEGRLTVNERGAVESSW